MSEIEFSAELPADVVPPDAAPDVDVGPDAGKTSAHNG
jgi:hypothetical protein